MKRNVILLFMALLMWQNTYAQEVIKLWPNGTIGNNESPKPEETNDGKWFRYVSDPTLYLYFPEKEKNTGAAILICPGGGYGGLAMEHEGYEVAKFLQSHGIAGIVLKYRMPFGHHEIPLMDAKQAMRMIRLNREKWGIAANKVGIIGFSAGGHLASTVSTHFDLGNPTAKELIDQYSCRPDFAALGYPVITMNEQWGHMGSRDNLIGKSHDLKLIHYYSNELQVTADTPPTFIFLADDDLGVLPLNSIEYYKALKEKGVSAELHIYKEGSHGFGMNKKGKAHDQWPDMLLEWMQALKII